MKLFAAQFLFKLTEPGNEQILPFPIVFKERLFVIRENALRPERCWPYVFVNPLDVESILWTPDLLRPRQA